MRKQLERILPTDDKKLKWAAVGFTVIIAGLLTLWGIYGIGQYGIALFVLTPLFIGASPVILYGIKKDITKREAWSNYIVHKIHDRVLVHIKTKSENG